MKKYIVTVLKVWSQEVEIEAESESTAKLLVLDGHGKNQDHTLKYVRPVKNLDKWEIREV